MWERPLTEQYTYQHYVKTAKKLRGSKYAVLLAKDFDGTVVGMAELGLNVVKNDDEEGGVGHCRRPTLGVLCVSSKYRGKHIGKELVRRCERIVANVWNETELYAEVEPDNTVALSFFVEHLGYDNTKEEVMVAV